MVHWRRLELHPGRSCSDWLAAKGGGGIIKAPWAPTCNSKVYDFFVVSATMAEDIIAVHTIADAGLNPHSPARLIVKGITRQTLVRQIKSPPTLPAQLPFGPLQKQDFSPDPLVQNRSSIDANYGMLATQSAKILLELKGLTPAEIAEAPSWAEGPRFKWKNIASHTATDGAKSNPIARAWKRTVEWLRAGVEAKVPGQAQSAVWRLLHYDHRLVIDDPALKEDAAAFSRWRTCLTWATLQQKVWVHTCLDVAVKEAKHVEAKAARLATARFEAWVNDGPAKGHKRQHLLSRAASGWIPSKVGSQPVAELSELDELDGITEEQLKNATAPVTDKLSPLASQRLANSERSDWCKQWATDMQHDTLEWPEETEQLPPFTLQFFKAALFSFANGTGLGWDGVHPRALLRLPDEILYAWIALMIQCERHGCWSVKVGCVIVVLLPKPDGGFRPIGLIPCLPRVWMRCRRDTAKAWEVKAERSFLYAGAGKGSTIAAWKQAARAEIAMLLDLVKAFERIPYRVLLREARKLGYPLRPLKLAIATYKLARTIRVGEAPSDLAFAIRGIVAGSGTATTEMRLTMITIVDAALLFFPTVAPTLFVDDLALEHDGDEPSILDNLCAFTVSVMKRIQTDGMEVNRTKSLISASHPSLADSMAARMGNLALTIAHRVKSLGVGLAAGTARNVTVQNARLKNFKKRLPRYRMLRRVGVDTAMLGRTGGGSALMHGLHTNGVSPSTLRSQRSAAAAAGAPVDGRGGQELNLALIVADGSPKGKADPAVTGNTDVLHHWALAIWNNWIPRHLLQLSLTDAMARLAGAKQPWSVTYGPAAAVVGTTKRLGWTIQNATTTTSDKGRIFCREDDPPVVLARKCNDAVRRWRWRQIAEQHTSLPAEGANFGPIAKLLSSKRNDEM